VLANSDLSVRSGEPEHLDIDVPYAGREVQIVAAIFVGVSDHFRFTLSRCDLRARDKLVGGAHRPGLVGRPGLLVGVDRQSPDEHKDDQGDEQK
jgi:hypothetical protein